MSESSELIERLRRHASAIADEVTDRMFANPFWTARFGARARHHSVEDARHHLAYVAETLVLGDPEVFGHYARWLRSVLASRGMCSRHLADHFVCMAEVVETFDLGPDRGRIEDIFRYGAAALRYSEGLAGELQDRTASLVAACQRRLTERRVVEPGERCRDDIVYHLAYLADGLALDRPELFVAYAEWTTGFLASMAVPCEHFEATLVALGDALASSDASPELVAASRTILTAARKRVGQKRVPA